MAGLVGHFCLGNIEIVPMTPPDKKFPLFSGKIPSLSTDQMIEVDRLMIEDYKITLLQMMENAGRNLASLAKFLFLTGTDSKATVVVLAGTGGNGGGALVSARRLLNWGYEVRVYLTDEMAMTPAANHQLEILRNMKAKIFEGQDINQETQVDLIIDGIIGYSLKGDPKGNSRLMIDWANQQSSPVLSLDTPSGIDLTTGVIHKPVVNANATLTLALPKHGLFHQDVLPYRGDLYLGDIGVPPELYAKPSLALKIGPIFQQGEILKLD